MITKKEIITVSRDDPRAEMYDAFCAKENGWTKEECNVSVTYTRIQSFGGMQEKNNGHLRKM